MTIRFSNIPTIHKWANEALSTIALRARFLNWRGEPSPITMIKAIIFAYVADKKRTLALLEELKVIGEDERRNHEGLLASLQGRRKQVNRNATYDLPKVD